MPEPVIDSRTFDELRAVLGADFLAELLDVFFAQGPELVATMRRALAEANPAELERAAHSLKSNGRTFGALGLATLALELEAMGREQCLEGARERLAALADEYARAEAALRELRPSS